MENFQVIPPKLPIPPVEMDDRNAPTAADMLSLAPSLATQKTLQSAFSILIPLVKVTGYSDVADSAKLLEVFSKGIVNIQLSPLKVLGKALPTGDESIKGLASYTWSSIEAINYICFPNRLLGELIKFEFIEPEVKTYIPSWVLDNLSDLSSYVKPLSLLGATLEVSRFLFTSDYDKLGLGRSASKIGAIAAEQLGFQGPSLLLEALSRTFGLIQSWNKTPDATKSTPPVKEKGLQTETQELFQRQFDLIQIWQEKGKLETSQVEKMLGFIEALNRVATHADLINLMSDYSFFISSLNQQLGGQASFLLDQVNALFGQASQAQSQNLTTREYQAIDLLTEYIIELEDSTDRVNWWLKGLDLNNDKQSLALALIDTMQEWKEMTKVFLENLQDSSKNQTLTASERQDRLKQIEGLIHGRHWIENGIHILSAA